MGKGVVEVIIRAKDMTATVVARFRRRMRALTRVVKDVTRTIAASTVAIAGMVIGLQQLGAQGDKVLAVKRSFAKITGDETAALNKLRTASKGVVSDMQLMALHNQSLALGAAGTTAEFADQIEVVNRLARAQGITLSEGLEKFTVGMARLSKLRLDDLGITLDVEKANERYAAQLGKQVDALTDAERATAFRSAAMAQARELVDRITVSEDGASSATVRFATAMENLRDRLATFVAESPEVAAFFDGLTDVVSSLAEIVASGDTELLKQAFQELGRIAGNAFSMGVSEAVGGIRGFFGNMLEALGPEMSENERQALEEHKGMRGGDRRSAFEVLFDKLEGSLSESADLARENINVATEALAEIAAEAGRRRAEREGGGGSRGGGGRGGGGASSDFDITAAGFRGAPSFFSPDAIAAFEERRALRQRVASGSARMVPGSFGLAPGMVSRPGPGVTPLPEATKEFEEAGQVVAASMFGMAQAAVRGSDQVAASVVGMITQIAQSLPGVGGIFGTIIGGVGGLIGAMVGKKDRAPVPVRLQDVDDAAARKLQGATGPERIVTIIEQGGQEIERIERDLRDRQNRDEVVRYSRGNALTGR